MKISLFIFAFCLLFSSLYISSCTDKLPVPALDCSTSTVGYDLDIKPILDSVRPFDEIVSAFDEMKAGKQFGKLVVKF